MIHSVLSTIPLNGLKISCVFHSELKILKNVFCFFKGMSRTGETTQEEQNLSGGEAWFFLMRETDTETNRQAEQREKREQRDKNGERMSMWVGAGEREGENRVSSQLP